MLITIVLFVSCKTKHVEVNKKITSSKNLQDFYCVYFTREFVNDTLTIFYKNEIWKSDVLNTNQSLSLAKKIYLPKKGYMHFKVSINKKNYFAFRDVNFCNFFNISKIEDSVKIDCYEKEPKFY